MKIIIPSTKFKKDLKRYAKQPLKMERLLAVIRMLEQEITIPSSFKPHILKGKYSGCLECHIENDFLLIWIENDFIELLRLGTHSELFK